LTYIIIATVFRFNALII